MINIKGNKVHLTLDTTGVPKCLFYNYQFEVDITLRSFYGHPNNDTTRLAIEAHMKSLHKAYQRNPDYNDLHAFLYLHLLAKLGIT